MALKHKISHKWFLVGLASTLLVAPNATLAKYGTESISPILYNAIRFLLIGLVTLPFLIRAKDKFTNSNFKHSIISGLAMTVAVISYITAIKLSTASYVSVITLITPIVFILFSNKVTGERVNRRAMLGILLAVIGAMIVVLLPVAIRQSGDFVFYPISTLLTLLNAMAFPIAVIYYKKANDEGVPIIALIGISAWEVAFFNTVILIGMNIFYGTVFSGPNLPTLGVVLYSGLVVALIARILNVKSYEHIGAVRTSALAYLETFLAILIPVVVLREQLSAEMIIGGIVILLGVFVVEHHKSNHHKHHYIFKNH